MKFQTYYEINRKQLLEIDEGYVVFSREGQIVYDGVYVADARRIYNALP
jgi:hypothetical protein